MSSFRSPKFFVNAWGFVSSGKDTYKSDILQGRKVNARRNWEIYVEVGADKQVLLKGPI